MPDSNHCRAGGPIELDMNLSTLTMMGHQQYSFTNHLLHNDRVDEDEHVVEYFKACPSNEVVGHAGPYHTDDVDLEWFSASVVRLCRLMIVVGLLGLVVVHFEQFIIICCRIVWATLPNIAHHDGSLPPDQCQRSVPSVRDSCYDARRCFRTLLGLLLLRVNTLIFRL